MDHLGFNLYRSTIEGERGEQLNQAFIVAQGSGSAYHYVDTSAEPGQIYYYTLEDIDTDLLTTLHGPVSGRLAIRILEYPAVYHLSTRQLREAGFQSWRQVKKATLTCNGVQTAFYIHQKRGQQGGVYFRSRIAAESLVAEMQNGDVHLKVISPAYRK